MYTLNGSFKQFASNLQITNRQEEKVRGSRTGITNALQTKLILHPEKSHAIGSWDRNTLIPYLSEGDVDIMVVLNYGEYKDWADYGSGAVKVLDKFRSIIEEQYPSSYKRRDRNCITLQFSEYRVDVVPSFRYINGYYTIPDSVEESWIKTNPVAFAQLITSINKQMNGSFKPLIRMVKAWNREWGGVLNGFHIECMMYNRYKDYERDYTFDSMLRNFFEYLPSYLTSYSSAGIDPLFKQRVDGYLDNSAIETEREKIYRLANRTRDLAIEANNLGSSNEEESIKKWKYILGDFFPTYG